MHGPPPHFFVIGPLRTGSSLMARCLDDHEDLICLCESEINRTLFPDYFVHLHVQRMVGHGLDGATILRHLDRKRQNSVDDMLLWYRQMFPHLKQSLKKPNALGLGDKSPDFYRAPDVVRRLSHNHTLIYTVRDPRAIVRSIQAQETQTVEQKDRRWRDFKNNIAVWEPYLDRPNVIVSRYEDLVTDPKTAMARIYAHLGARPSERFLQPFARTHPRRFLWPTAVDWSSGVRKDFDPERARVRDADVPPEHLPLIYDDPAVAAFMARFGYSEPAVV